MPADDCNAISVITRATSGNAVTSVICSGSGTDTVLQPDLLVVCNPGKLDERGMRGPPDWVVEVPPPATAAHDHTVKLAAYERAGVPEVWLAHPTDRTVVIYRLAGTTNGRAAIFELSGKLAITAVPVIRIDWGRMAG